MRYMGAANAARDRDPFKLNHQGCCCCCCIVAAASTITAAAACGAAAQRERRAPLSCSPPFETSTPALLSTSSAVGRLVGSSAIMDCVYTGRRSISMTQHSTAHAQTHTHREQVGKAKQCLCRLHDEHDDRTPSQVSWPPCQPRARHGHHMACRLPRSVEPPLPPAPPTNQPTSPQAHPHRDELLKLHTVGGQHAQLALAYLMVALAVGGQGLCWC